MGLTDIVKVRAGSSHSLFLTKGGSVYFCGAKDGFTTHAFKHTCSCSPVKLLLGATKFIDIHTMHSMSILISTKGDIFCNVEEYGKSFEYSYGSPSGFHSITTHKAEIVSVEPLNLFRKVAMSLITTYAKTDTVVLTCE